LGITEPDAGSDVAGVKTFAKRVDGGYLVNGSKMFITNGVRADFVVNGSKMFITNGVRADFIVTAVKTTEDGGHHGISFLIVDRGAGVSASPIEKMGWHASDTALIGFDDVFVPEENLLGPEHEGFKLIMANFQWERVMMALGAVGAMEALFERTLAFSLERAQFGKPIGRHQAIRHKLAEVALSLEAGRAITYNALRLHLAGAQAVQEVTMAKLATQRAAYDAADVCLQIHGGAGYMKGGVERAVRDLRLGPIGGGTDEIMREILGKTLGL
ncbi:MAG TPA: acyl-CoA dehydrogenase family protein, partial [Conexibacter sp.]|nr:acyl-CoA dehydrogenase family protein [Conexibacter sp.]